MLSRLLHGERLAVGENRAVETVLLVIGVDEEDGSLLYGVYDFVAYLFRQGGTAETAAEPARRVQERFRTVIRAVDDDGPFICLVVDARFESVEPQRITVAALIGVQRQVCLLYTSPSPRD